jgi:hypothetical protein
MTPRFFTSILPLVAGLFSPLAADAVQLKLNTIPNRGVFGVELAGTDSQFYARADQVLSVSWQEYTTGTYIVSEVVVDMANSGQQIRIYSLRVPGSAETIDAAGNIVSAASPTGATPPSLSRALPSAVQNIENRANTGVAKSTAQMPVKVYPTTTHAKTVEYVVGSRAELLSFYRSFRDLLCRKEVNAGAGSSVAGKNAATAFGTPAPQAGGQQATGAAGELTVNQLGGTLFIIQP